MFTFAVATVLFAPLPVIVKGPDLYRGKAKVRLEGINVPSLEWSNEGENVLRSTDVGLGAWNSNCIRLPLSQDRWFGQAPHQSDGGKAYRVLVDQVLAKVRARNAILVLDLHWSNTGIWGDKIAQHKMPDLNSRFFWEDVARRYKNDPSVLFDLYNEPRDVSWEVWRNGGMVEEDGRTYYSPGMQGLLDAVRSTGAKNAVVAGGLDWAYDLTGVVNGYALKDPKGNGVIYASHVYPWKSDWDGKVIVAAKKHPVLIGEVGAEPDPKQEDPHVWAPRVLNWIETNQLHWTAWCFHPSASPRMLKDWTYEPTEYWGIYALKALQARKR